MPRTVKKSRLPSKKPKLKIKPELTDTEPKLPPNLQSFKHKLLSGNGFVEHK